MVKRWSVISEDNRPEDQLLRGLEIYMKSDRNIDTQHEAEKSALPNQS